MLGDEIFSRFDESNLVHPRVQYVLRRNKSLVERNSRQSVILYLLEVPQQVRYVLKNQSQHAWTTVTRFFISVSVGR